MENKGRVNPLLLSHRPTESNIIHMELDSLKERRGQKKIFEKLMDKAFTNLI